MSSNWTTYHGEKGALISSCRIEEGGGHDRVHVWNRGGKAGVLVVNKGEGLAVVRRLLDITGGDDE